jgi:hypothetical protein
VLGRPRSAAVAVALDAICLVAFVLAGRQSHGLDSGAVWFFTVLWPIAVAWFAVAMIVGLYTRASRAGRRLGLTMVLGVGVGLAARMVLTHRDTPVAFVLVAFGFITVTTVGWRLVVAVVPRMSVRRRG